MGESNLVGMCVAGAPPTTSFHVFSRHEPPLPPLSISPAFISNTNSHSYLARALTPLPPLRLSTPPPAPLRRAIKYSSALEDDGHVRPAPPPLPAPNSNTTRRVGLPCGEVGAGGGRAVRNAVGTRACHGSGLLRIVYAVPREPRRKRGDNCHRSQ